jgi:hypothetical protein
MARTAFAALIDDQLRDLGRSAGDVVVVMKRETGSGLRRVEC